VEARFGYYANATAVRLAKCINSAGAVVSATARPPATRELVKIRASQINGCAALHRHAHPGRR
jgi:alkylhydroperoxidase family enzyme